MLGNEAAGSHWEVSEQDNGFIVTGAKIEKFARRTNMDQYEAVDRVRDIMKKMGITHELIRHGAAGDSLITIGDRTFPLVEQ